MKDRVPANPGRVLITPEDGSAPFYAVMTRADNPTQAGDPLNKNTLLKDATAALFGLGEEAVPDDVLNLLAYVKYSSIRHAVMVEIKESTTWVAPANILYNEVLAVVVGGGGGGSACGYEARNYGASGGGSGGITIQKIKVTPGQSYTAIIGAGGSGGTVSSSSGYGYGGDGGASSFADLIASGGQGANANGGGDAAPNGGGGGGTNAAVTLTERGGNGGTYGGGGGGYGLNSGGGIGGNGGTYGGGGGGYSQGGVGGAYGGIGGGRVPGISPEQGYAFDPLISPFGTHNFYPYVIEPNEIATPSTLTQGGGGFGSNGGNGGDGLSNASHGGGGGGFCGNGGFANQFGGSGGGGGFCCTGGTGVNLNSRRACGGGGGFFADGQAGKVTQSAIDLGRANQGGAGGGGLAVDSTASDDYPCTAGSGGNGLVLLFYQEVRE